jgi:DNA/RNA-binding domain of Phe-tRNA-synthetase-like protein
MKTKTLTIAQEVFDNYPEISIGFMVVDNLHQIAIAKLPEEIKILSTKGISENAITLQNLVEFPTIATWRQIYQNCGVKPKTFKSSIESLLRRFLQKDYKGIIPIVDLYNYISSGYILSVGGYNIEKIEGTLTLRYGKHGDRFIPLNGKEDITVSSQHIIYADENQDEPVICWMWNHKDSKRTMLTNEVKTGLFIFDCVTPSDKTRLIAAQEEFSKNLIALGATVVSKGFIDNINNTIIL